MDALSTTMLSACNVTNQRPSIEAADPPAGELRIPWPWGVGGEAFKIPRKSNPC